MDPAEFGYSTTPLHHAPYGPLLPSALLKANTSKVAVITGAGRGIGAAIAKSLAASGAHVVLLDLTLDSLSETSMACKATGVQVRAYAADVTDEKNMISILDEVERELGPIDVLVNNAGVFDQRPFIMSSMEGFWRQIEVNFKGVSNLFRNSCISGD